MSALSRIREQARDFLQTVGAGAFPEWRVCHSTDGTDEPTGLAPVCPDEDHDPDDSSVYNCCPDPVIEVDSGPLAAYLVELLNADAEQFAPALTRTVRHDATAGELAEQRHLVDELDHALEALAPRSDYAGPFGDSVGHLVIDVPEVSP